MTEEIKRDDTLLGSGEWTYRMVNDWAKLPDGWSLGEAAAVTVDDKDNVYVFTRGPMLPPEPGRGAAFAPHEHPVLVFDRDGNFLRTWGDPVMFPRPHGIAYGADGFIYCTDDGSHTVRKFTTEGKLVLEIGVPGRSAAKFSGEPFNRCTHTALSPQGDIFVSDGYGNGRMHKFSPDGKLLKSWGQVGCLPGEFNLPHQVTTDADGWVYVADRENHRVQVFDEHGRYETQWNNLHRPCALCTQTKSKPFSFIGEAGPGLAINYDAPNLGPRITIVDHQGKQVARLGDSVVGVDNGQFLGPHGIAVDSRLDLYVTELGTVAWTFRYPGRPLPTPQLPNLKKLVRVPVHS